MTYDKRNGLGRMGKRWGSGLVTLARSDVGLLTLVFILYIRLPAVIRYLFGASSHTKFFILLLLLVIFARWMLDGEKSAEWGYAILWVGGYGLVSCISMLFALDVVRAHHAMLQYAKDAVLVFIVVALLRRLTTLHRVIWTLLTAGIVMGTISAYQHWTGAFDHTFLGFGHFSMQYITGDTVSYRVAGPIGEYNYYAQVLLVLIPLALDRLWRQRRWCLRLLAAWALVVCGLSLVFTYSRGAFVGLLVMVGVMVVRRPPRPLTLLVTLLLAVPLLQFVPTDYVARIKTFRYLIPGGQGHLPRETSFRGRLSENIVAWQMFMAYPLLGIGPGNYPAYYQRYSRRLGIDPRQEEREAHNLYLEIAAERGIVGLTVFWGLLWMLFCGLKRARITLARAGITDDAEMVAAFTVGMIGYLVAALFLHATYTHHFWLLVGIAFAIPQAAKLAVETIHEVPPRTGSLSAREMR